MMIYAKSNFILIELFFTFLTVATILTGLGLRTQDHNLKYKFYRVAVLIMMVACKLWLYNILNIILKFDYFCLFPVISLLVALILYPVCFASELSSGNFNLSFFILLPS